MGKGDVKRGRGLLALAILTTIFSLSASVALAGWTGLIPPEVSFDWKLSKISFSSPLEGWAVGEDMMNGTGVLLRYSIGSWAAIAPPGVSSNWALSDVHITSLTEGWATGTDWDGAKGVLLHFTGGGWTAIATPVVSPDWFLSAVHFPSINTGWAVGTNIFNKRGVILEYLDGLWAAISPPVVSTDWELRAVHFSSESEGWAVGRDNANGRGVLLHYAAGFWQTVTPPVVSSDWELRAVHFSSESEGWAVGRDNANGRGVLLHFVDGIWHVVSPPEIGPDWELNSVRFPFGSEGWAVGGDMFNGRGVLLHFVGGAWTMVSPPGISLDWGLLGVDFVSPYQGIAAGWDRMNRTGVLLQYFSLFPEMIVTPNVVNFGNAMLGSFSEQEVSVKNDGFSDLILFSVSDALETPFSRVGGDCKSGTVLSPGEGCTMVFQFAPISAGAFTSEITIFSNDLYAPELLIPVNGASGPDLFGQWEKFFRDCKTKRGEIGCEIKAVFEVRNIGNLEASSSVVKFYLSDDPNLNEEEDLLIGRKKIGALKPAKNKDVKLKFKLERGVSPTGKYLIAVMDANNDVVEADETNNIAIFGPIP